MMKILKKKLYNLQLFAEGGGEGGAPAGQAVGSNAAPLATAAATRAMNVNNPNQDLTRG